MHIGNRLLRLGGASTLGMLCLAVVAVAQPETPAKPDEKAKPAEPVKTTPAKLAEKTISFEMRDKPWSSVLEWLSEQTGLPVITTAKPTGTFTFIASRASSAKKSYTIPEVIDILNEALLNQKYILIRREASFTIVPADDKIDPAILPRILVSDLDKRGNTEMVSVILPLTTLVAEDVSPEVKKMMGPFGEIVTMNKANQLVLQDTAGNIRRILKTIKEIEDNEKGQNESYSHTCQYIKARDAERILRELMGDPRELMRQIMAAQQPSFGRDMRDPRDMRDTRMPTPAVATPKIRMYYLTADDRTNAILVTGPADKTAQAKDILKKIDVPQPGQKAIPVGAPFLKTYPVAAGTADAVSKTLQEVYKANPTIRISAVGNSQVMVWAGPAEHFEIADHVRGAGPAPNATPTELISLGAGADASRMSDTLKGMFGSDVKTGSPYIEADVARNAIIVRGTPEQVKDIREAVKAITDVNNSGGNMRVITIDGGAAPQLAEEIKRVLTEMGRNPVKVVVPADPNKPAPPPAEPRPLPPSKPDGGAKKPTIPATWLADARDNPPLPPGAGKPGAPVTITVIGNKLFVTSEDPAALALVSDLVRIATQGGTDGDFEVIRLTNANAVDAARILDEVFNGPKERTQQGGSGFPFSPFGGFGGFSSRSSSFAPPSAPAASASPSKVRIVADPISNSLLVKAPALDILKIKRLLKESIDRGETDSKAVARTHLIGPLKYASAQEVRTVINDVYRDSLSGGSTSGGFGGFSFFSSMGRSQRPTDAQGNPKASTLSVGVDDRSNSIIVQCSDAMFEDVKKLAETLDEAAKTSNRTVKVVSIKGIDPALVQQALDAIQGRSSSLSSSRNGSSSSRGGFSGSSFAPSFGPSFGPTMGGFGGFSGGSSFGGSRSSSSRGSSSSGSRPRRQAESPPGVGGRDFFDYRVTDDPIESQLYDPQQDRLNAEAVAQSPELQPVSHNEAVQPQPPQPQPPQPGQPAKPDVSSDIRGPRSPVTAEALEELGVLVISGNSQADIEEVLKIIEFIQKQGGGAEPQLRLVPLEQGDATSIAATLNQVFTRILVGPNGNVSTPTPSRGQVASPSPFLAANQALQQQPGTVLLLPLPRFNAILVGAPKGRLEDIVTEIKRLDMPTSPQARPNAFPLKRAAANRIANLVQQFYAQRYPNETAAANQVRVSYDDSTNTVFVQASPADLAEIKELIERIDSTVSNAVNELRVIQLRNAPAEELAATLIEAITRGVLPQTGTGVPQVNLTGQGGQLGGQFGQLGQLGNQANRLGQGANALGTTPTGVVTKTTALRFRSGIDPNKPVETGLLEDVHITPDARVNALIVSAPEKTMQLLLGLIQDLDTISPARAEINIFTLKRADASLTATLLQTLFLGSTTGTTGPAATGPGATARPGAALGGTTGTNRPLLTLTGQPGDGATLIDLKITVDDRTNSVIVAGTRNDLEVIAAIIARLEDNPAEGRRNEVYKLHNQAAADVASALTTFITNSLAVLQRGSQLTSFAEISRDVVVVAEPISNNLLISATPKQFAEVMRLVAQLDAQPPQVMIQVLIAEVQMTNTEEFGVEVGLQSPILFQRSVTPAAAGLGNGTISYANAAGGLVPPGVTVNSTINPTAQPGFNFNNTALPLGNNPLVNPGIVGFQGLGSLGVGRANANNLGGLVFSAASDSFSLLIRALKTQGRIDILSRPQIMTLDNQQAFIVVGQSFPYVTGQNISALGNVINTVQYRDVGIILRVTPRITPDGRVFMRVEPEISSVQNTQVPLGNNAFATAFNVQQVSTTVAAADGETVAVGGLITRNESKQENKIPWLGDLPWVGSAFRYRTMNKSKRELLVILTPHIVRCAADADRLRIEESQRIDWILQDAARVHGSGVMDGLVPSGPVTHGEAAPLPPASPLLQPIQVPGPEVAPVPAPVAPVAPSVVPVPEPLPAPKTTP